MNRSHWKSIGPFAGLFVAVCLIVVWIAHTRAESAGAAPDTPSDPFKLVGADVIETSVEAIKASDIQTISVELRNVPVTLTLTARSGLNMEDVTHVHAQFGGKVKQVAPELGAVVRGPEDPSGPTVLCVIESNDLAQAKANYLQAKVQLTLDQQNLDRTRELVKSTVLAEKFLLDAQSAVIKDTAVLDASRQQLLVFGLKREEVERVVTQEGRQRMDYVITSPRSGVVAEKGVSGGEIADPTINLFTVADTSTVWVWGDVYERDLRQIGVGEPMKIIFASDLGHPRDSKIDWISPVLDPNTHSIRIRGVLDNKDGRLLADMYGTMAVTVNPGNNAMVIAADCLVRDGDDAYVFVKIAEQGGQVRFRKTKVIIQPVDVGFGISDSAATALAAGGDSSRTGAGEAARPIRVVDGVKPGDVIVVSGALGLFNEIQQQTKL